jgi:hypothetical protein
VLLKHVGPNILSWSESCCRITGTTMTLTGLNKMWHVKYQNLQSSPSTRTVADLAGERSHATCARYLTKAVLISARCDCQW